MFAALPIVLLVVIVLACWCIQGYLLVTKQLSNPHEILALAGRGHRLARFYVALFIAALIVLLVSVVLMFVR